MSDANTVLRDIRCPRCGFFVDEEVSEVAEASAVSGVIADRLAALDTPDEIALVLIAQFNITISD